MILEICDLILKQSGINRMLSLSHGAFRCVTFGTDKLNFGDGVTLSVGSSKSHFAFLKSFPHGIGLILL